MSTAPIAQGPVDVIVSRLSPDDLLRLNGSLAACVSILIEACKRTPEGRVALSKWDRYRGEAANAPHEGRTAALSPASVLSDVLWVILKSRLW